MNGTRIGFVLASLALGLAACSDAPDLNGAYQEEPSLSQGFPDGQWFATGLDLFQYEEDVGGILRYYSLKDPIQGRPTFDPLNERFCFWVNPTNVGDSDRSFELSIDDDISWPEAATATFQFETDNTGDVLSGSKLTICNHPLCDGRTPDERCNDAGCLVQQSTPEPNEDDLLPGIRGPISEVEVDRALRLSRVSTSPRNDCERRHRPITLEIRDLPGDDGVLQISRRSGQLNSDVGPRRFTYTVAWAGSGLANYTDLEEDDDQLQRGEQDLSRLPFIFDWYRRAVDTPAPQRVRQDRWLPPGFWSLDSRSEAVGTQAKMLVGTYFLYYEDTSNRGEAPYDSTNAVWTPSTEPIIASPFAASEEPNSLEGTVVVWIEGKPSLLPEGTRGLFPADADLQEGYSLWDAIIEAVDSPGQIRRFKAPSNGRSLVRLHVTRKPEDYSYPVHTELSIARLPVP